MRYCLRDATSVDLTFLMSSIAEGRDDRQGLAESLPGLCRLSRRVWIALDPVGAPAALFGVTPVPGDPVTGQFWLLLFRSFDDGGRDLAAMTRLVMDEILREFERVENVVDSRKSWVLQLLSSIGFTVERAQATASGVHYQKVWQEGHCGMRPVVH